MYRTVCLKNSLLLVLMCFLLACADKNERTHLPYYNSPDFSPIFISDGDAVEHKITHTIADFSFTNQNEKTVTQQTVERKIHIANFVFTSCGSICPILTKHLKLVSQAFKNDQNLVILSFSVTPWIDNVKRLKAYTIKNGINDSNWHFLTGNKSEIYTLARKSYFAEEDLGFTKDSTDFLHTEHVLLIDKSKRIRGIYNGTLQLEIEQLIKDISTLKAEN